MRQANHRANLDVRGTAAMMPFVYIDVFLDGLVDASQLVTHPTHRYMDQVLSVPLFRVKVIQAHS